MSRKPVHLEMAGGKSPRQRIWEAIRKIHLKNYNFVPEAVIVLSGASAGAVRDYLGALVKGGYVKIVSTEKINAICVKHMYRLVRDAGVEAPRLTKAGEDVVQGSINDAMWGTLRRMFKTESVDYRQLAAFASTTARPVPHSTAKSYVLTLAAAGYLECVQPAARGRSPIAARYRLRPAMDSGNRSPMIQRTKTVFDPNWNKAVWVEKVEATDEQ